MKNLFKTVLLSATMLTSTLFTGNAQERALPEPQFKGGMSMNEVIANRHSVRAFDSQRNIDDEVLGQLLWITLGVNRPETEPAMNGVAANRSNPTARNWQEIKAYVFGQDAVWEYVPSSHVLKLVKEGDHRHLVAGTTNFSQDFVLDAPYSIVFVADMVELPEDGHAEQMAMVDTGIACENLNLACASLGIATVPRATMDIEAISNLLNLAQRQLPVMNNPIGYPK